MKEETYYSGGLEIIWKSLCFYNEALQKRIELNKTDLDEKETRLLYSRVIAELKAYSEDLSVELNSYDWKLFEKNPPRSEEEISRLESLFGYGYGQKARKWLAIQLLHYYTGRYRAISDEE